MSTISDLINQCGEFYSLGAASEDQVAMAEEALGLNFANEFREYVLSYGEASFDGHEFTGVCDAKRLDVVSVTEAERILHEDIPDDWYVIEQTGIDDITAWQSSSGEVYLVTNNAKDAIRYLSIEEYVQSGRA